MSAVVQTTLVGISLAVALGYLLYRLGLFELFGLLKKRNTSHCGACPRCPTAEQIAERLIKRD